MVILAYHGTADFTARTLSHGKFCGLIPTRSVAESVFTTHLLQEIRDKRLDLDAIAEALHTKAGNTVPTLSSSHCLPTNCKPTPPRLPKAPPSERSKPPLMISPAHGRSSRHMDWSSPPRKTQAPLPHLTNHRRSQTCFSRPTPLSRTTPRKHGPRRPSNNGCGHLSPKSKKQPRKSCVYSRPARFPPTSLRRPRPATASPWLG